MLNKEYWNDRWSRKETGWDIGEPSPPLMEYLLSSVPIEARILIPGSGRGYEAGTAFQEGYTNVFYNDISPYAAEQFRGLYPDFPQDQIIVEDFFSLEGEYDFCLEQTSFCAHPPERRSEYLAQVRNILSSNGRYSGVFFDIHFPFKGPPFGGDKEEYQLLFSDHLKIIKMAKCYNSIIPRQDKELFVISASK